MIKCYVVPFILSSCVCSKQFYLHFTSTIITEGIDMVGRISFTERVEKALDAPSLRKLASELDERDVDGFHTRKQALAERVASDELCLTWQEAVCVAEACSLQDAKHLVLQHYIEGGRLSPESAGTLGVLIGVFTFCELIDRSTDDGKDAFRAVRDAAMPLLDVTHQTTKPELVAMVRIACRVNLSYKSVKIFRDSVADRGVILCMGAQNAARLADDIESAPTANALLMKFAARLAEAGVLHTDDALELLRAVREIGDDHPDDKEARHGIISLLLSNLRGDEPSFDVLKELASFVSDPGGEGTDCEPVVSLILELADPHISTPRQAVDLALQFGVASGHHGALTRFARRPGPLLEEACMLFTLLVFPGKHGADELMGAIAAKSVEAYGFNPQDLIDHFQRFRPRKSVARVLSLGGTGDPIRDAILRGLVEFAQEESRS